MNVCSFETVVATSVVFQERHESLARRQGTAGYVRELEGDTWVILCVCGLVFVLCDLGSTSFQFLRLTRGISFWFLLNGSVTRCG